MTPRRTAIVIGGGLAGVATAMRLSESNWCVTLLETRKRLGGRATSHVDPVTQQLLDNCQHVLLGCCTNLVDLYTRLGVDHLIEWHDTLHFLDRKGHHDKLGRSPLPAPMHLSGSLLKFDCLSWTAKWAIARAMLAMLRLPPAHRAQWADKTFAEWLASQKQPQEAIERFWEVIIVSALNENVQTASAVHALQVFQDGFLSNRDAYVVGLASVPLVKLYEPAAPILESRGGAVRLGASVRQINFQDNAITSIELSDGQQLSADLYISALPVERLDKLLTPEMRTADERLRELSRFEFSPILGIHLWYEREVMHLPHAVTLDSPLQWVFNRGLDVGTSHQHLHVVISAARDWIDLSTEEILRRVREELAIYLPKTNEVNFIDGQVIKERRATFSATPRIEASRPPTTGAIRNLILAGDYCNTGWPATMEGAVRSGYMAAEAITGHPSRVDDLPASFAVDLLWSVLT